MKNTENRQLDEPLQRSLLDRIADNDRQAMEQFYQSYQVKLASFLFRMAPYQNLVEEIFNDTMMVVWQQAGQFEGRSKVSTWVYGIAYRQCLKRLKKEKKHRPATEAEQETASSEKVFDDQVDLVKKALANLSPAHRSVIELSYYLGCDYSEIATIVDCPENTVKTRMFYARKKLKEVISSMDIAI